MSLSTRHIEVILPESGVVARRFDGVDDEVRVAIDAADCPSSITMAALVRIRIIEAGTLIMQSASPADGAVWLLQIVNQRVGMSNGFTTASNASFETFKPSDGWGIVATTKAAGTATPRLHLYKLGTWYHIDATATLNDEGLDQTGGTWRFATFVSASFSSIDLAAAAVWNTALSDGNIETLSSGSTTDAWYDLSPQALWNFNQTSVVTDVVDLVGNSDETAITGTEVINDGPSGWVYDVSAPTAGNKIMMVV